MSERTGTALCILLVAASIAAASAEDRRSQPINMMCGQNCLWWAARTYGIQTELKRLGYLAGSEPFRGTTLKGMLRALKYLELQPVLVKSDISELAGIPYPTILLFDKPYGHYSMLGKVQKGGIETIDPPEIRILTRDEFTRAFTGYAIVVCGDARSREEFERSLAASGFGLRRIFILVVGLAGGVAGCALLVRRLGIGRARESLTGA